MWTETKNTLKETFTKSFTDLDQNKKTEAVGERYDAFSSNQEKPNEHMY